MSWSGVNKTNDNKIFLIFFIWEGNRIREKGNKCSSATCWVVLKLFMHWTIRPCPLFWEHKNPWSWKMGRGFPRKHPFISIFYINIYDLLKFSTRRAISLRATSVRYVFYERVSSMTTTRSRSNAENRGLILVWTRLELLFVKIFFVHDSLEHQIRKSAPLSVVNFGQIISSILTTPINDSWRFLLYYSCNRSNPFV